MKSFSTLNVKHWIPLTIIAIYLALSAFELFDSYHNTIEIIESDSVSRLESTLFETSHFINYASANGVIDDIERIITNLHLTKQIDKALVVDSALTVIYSSKFAWKNRKVTEVLSSSEADFFKFLLNESTPIHRLDNHFYGFTFIDLSQTRNSPQKEVLFISYDITERVEKAFHNSLKQALPVLLVTLLTGLIMVFLLNRFVTKPITLLGKFVEKINSPTERLENPLSGNNELVAVGDALASTAKQIRHDIDALKDRENRLSITLDAIADGVIVTDQAGIIKRLNPTAEMMTGWIEAEALDKPSDRIFRAHHLDDRNFINPVAEVIHTGQPIRTHNHTVLISKKDAELQIYITASPIFSAGVLVGVILVFQDVTREYMLRAKLRESVDFLENLLEISPSITFVLKCNDTQREFGFTYVSESIYRYAGFTSQEWLGLSHQWADFVHPDDIESIKHHFIEAVSKPGLLSSINFRFLDKDKHYLTFNVNLIASKTDDAEIQVVAVAIDISKQVEHEQKMLFLGNVLERSLNEIYIVDAHSYKFIQVNYGALQNLGYSMQEMASMVPLDFLKDIDEKHFEDFLQPLKTGEKNKIEMEAVQYRKNGSKYPVIAHLQKDFFGEREVFVAIITDITESKISESKINFLAYHDVLTRLPNQTLFNEQLSQAIASCHRENQQFALMYMDLDRFKTINDTMGHAVGDELIKLVAQRMKSLIREQDSVSRTGGDEFTLLLVNTDSQGAAHLAEKLLKVIAEPYEINNRTIHVTTSIGISMFPDNGTDGLTLKQKADSAMYKAKENKRNSYQFFTEQMHQQIMEKMHLERQLHAALEEGEFRLAYQPQLDLKTNKIIGAEALIRWQTADGQQISPTKFIPIAEESGLISEIGDWVLHEAIKQAADWRDQVPRPFVVSINISAFQFRSTDFVEKTVSLLNEHNMNPSEIEIEITESTAMQDLKHTVKQMHNLAEAGISISMDDFGTGFSSLSALKQFPFKKLKIDKSFIDDMLTDEDSAAIVDAIITMAETMNLTTVAEGVETELQLEKLKQKGCDVLQGYLFAKPLTPAQFTVLCKQHYSLSSALK